MQAILPEKLREGAPVGFAAIGHIGKYNLPNFILILTLPKRT